MDATSLTISILAGSIGFAYFIYGKKQSRPVPLIAGIGLCILPYFISNMLLLGIVCLLLTVAPFVISI